MNNYVKGQSYISNGILRIAFGWIFFWAWLDKLFGLGFSTTANKGWLDGGSPTYGFLKMASKGPFQSLFQSMAGNTLVNWLFMLGLLGIGIALLSGIAIRFASLCALTMMILMWLVVLPPAQNPIIDDHVIYALVFLLMARNPLFFTRLSIYPFWASSKIVQKFPFLK